MFEECDPSTTVVFAGCGKKKLVYKTRKPSPAQLQRLQSGGCLDFGPGTSTRPSLTTPSEE